MTLTERDGGAIAAALEAEWSTAAAAAYRPRYNVAPGDRHPVLRAEAGRRTIDLLAWGMRGGGTAGAARGRGRVRGDTALINARAESLAIRDRFREAFIGRRCVIPADGFFEWRKLDGGRRRQPYWFHADRRGLLCLAGLYDEDGENEGRFVVVTVPAGAAVRPVHDRMPAVLDRAGADRWLAAPDLDVLRPAADGVLVATPVATRVNNVAHDDPACIAPIDPDSEAGTQLRLV